VIVPIGCWGWKSDALTGQRGQGKDDGVESDKHRNKREKQITPNPEGSQVAQHPSKCVKKGSPQEIRGDGAGV